MISTIIKRLYEAHRERQERNPKYAFYRTRVVFFSIRRSGLITEWLESQPREFAHAAAGAKEHTAAFRPTNDLRCEMPD